MKSIFLLAITLVGFSYTSISQEETPELKAILTIEDIDRFIETTPQLSEDIEKAEIDNSGDVNIWAANEKARAIIEKYGWSYETFPLKFAAITLGYTYIKMTQALDELPEDQKAAAEPMLAQYNQQYLTIVHKDDIELVRTRLDKLDAMEWDK